MPEMRDRGAGLPTFAALAVGMALCVVLILLLA